MWNEFYLILQYNVSWNTWSFSAIQVETGDNLPILDEYSQQKTRKNDIVLKKKDCIDDK